MRRSVGIRGAVVAVALAVLGLPGCESAIQYVSVVEDNDLADGFDFPVEPGEMDGWREPPEADEAWDASSYLVHRDDGIHAAIDFMREDGSSSAGFEMWAIADGIVVDVVHDREVCPDLHDGGDRDEGWGNLILVQHDYLEDGVRKRIWSQYAHCATVEVELGEGVDRNQRIGLVGRTDGVIGVDSWSEHLHFEIRTTPLVADAWPQSMGLNTDAEVEAFYTHPLEFIRAHWPVR